MNKSETQLINNSQIVGIQFSILSPEEIRNASVVHVTSRETYVNNKPVINGLFDPRMGVLEPGLICPTDGKDYIQTPGYFGHIELARPVFYVHFMSTIQKIIKCVCFKCGKLLINKQKYEQALNMSSNHRWSYVYELCKNVKRCGDDTENGCGCKQPDKIKLEGIATLIAEWESSDENAEPLNPIHLTAEIVLKIFKRISDDDVTFMGFSPLWSRPDWMICQVLAVPPPSVRPSVKHDAQQRSEDDLTHILVNIIKTNKTLLEKIQNNSKFETIQDWTDVLQYYIASMVDNKLKESNPIAQRSGRPYKSIKDRLNGKTGRMRGNLMAKRVDFSARSVITADPNISIQELGIPMKIAKNITKPVKVNDRNKEFLLKLVHNGPDNWPGAKILERSNGENVTLRYLDRKSISLENGDIVHRHMMDGDVILFNRQPTLHRMSMMCHIAKIMHRGDTFRMNVADTKPYNADFDGDEMNLHMPQGSESEAELRHLASVKYQIISPGNNSSIIGIYQDSMLGSYQFTRENIKFSKKDAMNLLMLFNNIDISNINNSTDKYISNFDILSQIFPPLTLKEKNKKHSSSDDNSTTNNIIEINNGKYVRGQLDKGSLGSGTKGIIHRICNDFGNTASSDFIDNLQNIITAYMTQSSFSVGISDLIVNNKTNEKIVSVLTDKKTEVKNLIDQVQLGIFENMTGKSSVEEFETKVSNILGVAQSSAGREALNALSKNNRFVVMFNAGSKGSELNIQQMVSCLGQQNVDGKRIGYGFDNRTLPHYSKYDDSAIARGFVESSYINGLSPQELFFHAMGGRIGLIDTAVKTSTTGYIQRRLIKGLEDIMVHYDMTLRNSHQKIVQFSYGEDSIDTIKVENQILPIINMNIQDIYNHFNIVSEGKNKYKTITGMFIKPVHTRLRKEEDTYDVEMNKYIELIIKNRKLIVTNVFNNKSESVVRIPVAFAYIIKNISGQQNINSNSLVDITLLDAYNIIKHTYDKLEQIIFAPPTLLFKLVFWYYLSPKDLLINKRFNKKCLEILSEKIILAYKQAIVNPGDMVGMIGAQSIGEPTTQMTLNTFHFAGVASKSNVSRGVPRIEEILALTANIKHPSLTVYLKPEDETDKEKTNSIRYMIEQTKLEEIVKTVEICFDPDDMNTLIEEDKTTMSLYKEFENMVDDCLNNKNGTTSDNSQWILRLELDQELMFEKNITMDDVNFALSIAYKEDIYCVFSDYNSDKLIIRIRMTNILKNPLARSGKKSQLNSLDQSDQIYILKNFQDQLLSKIVLRGVKNIDKVIMRKIKDNLIEDSSSFKKQEIWVLDTVGTNLITILEKDYIDSTRTISNDIIEIFNVLGMDAARQCIFNELTEVLEFDGAYVNAHHISLLCDRMTYSHKLVSIFRHGINNDDIGPIAKASFEETPGMFIKAAEHAELDTMRGVSANVMCGQEGMFGTSAFQVILDMEEMNNLDEQIKYELKNEAELIEHSLMGEQNVNNTCSTSNLTISTNITNIKTEKLGDDTEYNPF